MLPSTRVEEALLPSARVEEPPAQAIANKSEQADVDAGLSIVRRSSHARRSSMGNEADRQIVENALLSASEHNANAGL